MVKSYPETNAWEPNCKPISLGPPVERKAGRSQRHDRGAFSQTPSRQRDQPAEATLPQPPKGAGAGAGAAPQGAEPGGEPVPAAQPRRQPGSCRQHAWGAGARGKIFTRREGTGGAPEREAASAAAAARCGLPEGTVLGEGTGPGPAAAELTELRAPAAPAAVHGGGGGTGARCGREPPQDPPHLPPAAAAAEEEKEEAEKPAPHRPGAPAQPGRRAPPARRARDGTGCGGRGGPAAGQVQPLGGPAGPGAGRGPGALQLPERGRLLLGRWRRPPYAVKWGEKRLEAPMHNVAGCESAPRGLLMKYRCSLI